jgi:hypothetical protein
MSTAGSKKILNPAARQSKSKGSGGDGDGVLPQPASSSVPPLRSNNSQMAAKCDTVAERLAADRLAREARLDARRLKKPAAVGSDGPSVHAVSVEPPSRSSSVRSSIEPEPSEAYETASPLDADSSSGGGTATVPPVENPSTTEASATPSLTPSLSFLMNPTSSISGDQSAHLDRTSASSVRSWRFEY